MTSCLGLICLTSYSVALLSPIKSASTCMTVFVSVPSSSAPFSSKPPHGQFQFYSPVLQSKIYQAWVCACTSSLPACRQPLTLAMPSHLSQFLLQMSDCTPGLNRFAQLVYCLGSQALGLSGICSSLSLGVLTTRLGTASELCTGAWDICTACNLFISGWLRTVFSAWGP